MKIYLASRYSRRNQMREFANELAGLGHTVTSRWIDTDFPIAEAGQSAAAPPELREKYAQIDLEDIDAADMLVNFAEAPGSGGRGGRHVEFGYALAKNKQMVVIGYYEHIFCHHPAVRFYSSHWNFLRSLGETA